MPSCVIKSCKSDTRKHTKATGITFHEFPQSTERREKWIRAMLFTRNPGWRPSKRSSICSLHFHESDFYITNKGLRRLKKTAIPKFNLPIHSGRPQHLETFEIDEPSTSTLRNQCYESPTFKSVKNSADANEVTCKETPTDVAMNADESHILTNESSMKISSVFTLAYCDHPEPYLTPPRNSLQYDITSPISSHSDINSYLESPKTYSLKTKLRKKTILADLRLKKLKKLQRINRRLIKQNCSLKIIINDLKEKRYNVEKKLSKSNVGS